MTKSYGDDTGSHPGRQVGPHLSPHWRPISEGSHTGPMGQAFARLERPDDRMSITAWQGSGGHHAEVNHETNASYGHMRSSEHTRYVAGPFRTAHRARIAGEALGHRAASDTGTAMYKSDSYYEDHGRYI